jgi:hypothetical protein
LRIKPRRVALGGAVTLEISLRSASRRAQTLLIDYAVHFLRADGLASRKVFKGWQLELAAGEVRLLSRRLPLRPVTTRRACAGVHRVELLVNGRSLAEDSFRLSVSTTVSTTVAPRRCAPP